MSMQEPFPAAASMPIKVRGHDVRMTYRNDLPRRRSRQKKLLAALGALMVAALQTAYAQDSAPGAPGPGTAPQPSPGFSAPTEPSPSLPPLLAPSGSVAPPAAAPPFPAATAAPPPAPEVPAASSAAPAPDTIIAPPTADPDTATDGLTPVPTGGVPALSPGSTAASQLPHDLSPWGMYLQADIVVKAVMIGLLLASLATWTVWLAKSIELRIAKNRLRSQLRKLAAANSLHEAKSLLEARRGAVPAMIGAAIDETRASWDIADKHAIKERVTLRLERVELAAGRDINRGTGLLATIGSTSPFVGLFGTVWGIMNSFIGIAESQTTNLAIVAPGIAEALLATAIGLVAAIPAVIIYNKFTRSIGGYKALVGDASVAVQCLVARDFDRGVRHEVRAAE